MGCLVRVINYQLDAWEYILYLFAFSQILEEGVKLWKSIRLSSSFIAAVDFWTVVTVFTDVLLLTALVFRVRGIFEPVEVSPLNVPLKFEGVVFTTWMWDFFL